MRREYQQRFDLSVLGPLGFNNTFAVAMRPGDAQRLGVSTLSGLAAHAPQLRLGIGYEFLDRSDGYQGLVRTYGLRFAEAPRVMDLGLLYRALQSRQVDVIVGSATDGPIAALGLTVLEDDRHYFPSYYAVPVVRREALERYPRLGGLLNGLAGRISTERMRQLNYEVDGQKQDAQAVVHRFLQVQLGAER
jgi:osmoprotectant transport system substrate-binding protein